MARAERGARVPRIALTGGIASGKSTVARLFETLGARLIDTDHIAREVVRPGTPGLQAIIERFGEGVLAEDGSLNRAALRALVFADAAARADLEAILHPRIRDEVDARSATLGGPYQLIAVPLLAETLTQHRYDRVLVVDCDPAQQLTRLMQRDGIDATAAQRILDAQATRAQRLAIADDVILNDGEVSHLAAQVERLHWAYLQTAGYAQ
ncbi:MAG: dephospho-CoA kinase [Nevskiaceae bacterium]|jgi:dephospho-CoA kinase|nr:dephospho-CoA kinase [Nevskiaceae bacterium]